MGRPNLVVPKCPNLLIDWVGRYVQPIQYLVFTCKVNSNPLKVKEKSTWCCCHDEEVWPMAYGGVDERMVASLVCEKKTKVVAMGKSGERSCCWTMMRGKPIAGH